MTWTAEASAGASDRASSRRRLVLDAVGIEALAVLLCLVLTVSRRNLLIGLVAAGALVAIVRAI
jgi:hypothetical protein